MLKLGKGWAEARDHAGRAVDADTRLRAFFEGDDARRSLGLLFGCEDACPLMEAPLGELS